MAGNYLGALCAQCVYVNAEPRAPALFYLVLMANPDTVESKYSSDLPMTTAPQIWRLGGIYIGRTLNEFLRGFQLYITLGVCDGN